MAVLAIAAAGAGMGWTIAGTTFAAQLGWTIGGLIGNALFAPTQKLPDGPTLDDTTVTSSADGQDIVHVWGNGRVPGRLIVSEDRQPHTVVTKSGGKGGGKTTQRTTYYTATCAYSFGVPHGSGGQLRRLWLNKRLVVDFSAGGSQVEEGLSYAWYDSTQTEPDATLEALIGEGNVPAYTGQMLLVLTDLNVTDHYGSQVPQVVEAEIVTQGYVDASHLDWQEATDGFSGSVNAVAWGNGLWVAAGQYGQLATSTDGLVWTMRTSGFGATTIKDVTFADGLWVAVGDAKIGYSADAVTWTQADLSGISGLVPGLDAVAWGNGRWVAVGYSPYGAFFTSTDGTTWTSPARTNGFGSASVYDIAYHGGVWLMVSSGGRISRSVNGTVWSYIGSVGTGIYLYGIATDGATWAVVGSAGKIAISTNGGLAWSSVSSGTTDNFNCVVHNGTEWVAGTSSTEWVAGTSSGALRRSLTGTSWQSGTTLPWSPVVSIGIDGSSWVATSIEGHIATAGYLTIDPAPIDVGPVIEDLAAMAAVTAIDVTATIGQIDGYVMGRQTTARAAIEALMYATLIEAYPSDWLLRFRPIGAGATVTLEADDLGVRDIGEDLAPAEVTQLPTPQDLPRRLQLRYQSTDAELQTKMTEHVIYATGTRVEQVQTPVVMSDLAAAELAQTLLQMRHDSYSYELQLARQYIGLDVTDQVLIPIANGQVRARISEAINGANGVQIYKARAFTPEHLVTSAVAAGNADAAAVIVYGDVTMILLDCGLLRDIDTDHPGPYLTAYTAGDGFPGVALMQSSDDLSYTDVGTIGAEPIVGTCSTVPAAVDWETWDNTNTLRVTLEASGSLASETDSALINDGVNAALWGRRGAWELVQYGTATLVSAGVYDLSHLLRGRRGTDWMIADHAAGDWFIPLVDGTLLRQVLTNAAIGSARYYKAPRIGQAAADVTAISTTTGRAPLMPYSPIGLAASDAGGGDVLLEWTRRTRRGGTYGGPSSLTDGVGGPLEEDSEAYVIEALDDAIGTTVLASYPATTPSLTYAAADIATDYGGTPTDIYWRVRQVSAVAWHGYPSKIHSYTL